MDNNHSYIKISVADTGIGIEADALDRIFYPFEQIETSKSRKYQGTGLGLSIAHKIIEEHGGVIRVASSGPGQGSTFRIILPIYNDKDKERFNDSVDEAVLFS